MLKSKKWWLWSLVSVLLAIEMYLYVYIPSPIKIGRVEPFKVSPVALNRFISDSSRFQNWWKNLPGSVVLNPGNGDSIFSLKKSVFTVGKKIHEYENIHIEFNKIRIQSTFLIIPETKDSSQVIWSAILPNSLNPINRLKNYFMAIEISHIMDSLLDQFRNTLENREKLYGIPLQEISLVHDTFIASKITSESRPEISTIYKEINKLRVFAKNHGALQVDSPMLHIEKNAFHQYEWMVGIPLDKKIEESGSILFKQMPKGGKIIMGTVKGGGNQKIESGFKAIELYLSDIQRGTPAIPFQILKTNRIEIPDSNQWVTYLYYPVI